MDSKIAGLIAAAVALLCCGLPLLVAAGVVGGLSAWLASWPVVAVVVGIVVIAATLLVRRQRARRNSSECGNACDIEDRTAGRRTSGVSQHRNNGGSPGSHDATRADAQTEEVIHGDR
jgi:membrane protein implicated in regulation of membrane protease activity